MMAMQRLLVTMLMLFSFAAVALTVPAFGARMASNTPVMSLEHGSRHADADAAGEACEEQRACAENDAICYALCAAGTALWVAPASPANAAAATAAIWAFPEAPNRAGLGPARNERPPNDGLAERE
jgi:hypothetical protein